MTKDERIKLRDDIFEEFVSKRYIRKVKEKYSYNGRYDINKELLKVENKNLLEKYNSYVNEFRSKEEARYCLSHKDDYTNHLCPICNNLSKYFSDNRVHRYRDSCGNIECIEKLINNDTSKEKRKSTNKKRYGVDVAAKSPELIQKRKDTCKRLYGEDNPAKVTSIKEKIKKTNRERYGYDYTFQCEETKEKIKVTNNERYGHDFANQSKEVQDRIKANNIKKYGSSCILLNKEIKKKTQKTLIDKYGVDHFSKSQLYKEKIIKTSLENYGVEYVSQRHITNYDIWNNEDKFKEYIINRYNEKGTYLLLNEIDSFFNVCHNTLKIKLEKLNLLNYFYIQDSNLELEFKSFLDSNSISYKRNSRVLYNNIIDKYFEIDFLVDNNIGIEINDISTHNSLNKKVSTYKDPSYHLNKTLLALSYNIRLIHVWEWELRLPLEWNRLSKWILNLLNTNKYSIYSNNCTIDIVPLDKEIDFFNNYNLYGYSKSDICIGLYNKDKKLLQAISFNKHDKNYEIIRSSIKYGYNIINGTNVLLDSILSKGVESIITYCDISKEDTRKYENIGFKLDEVEEPNIVWCNKDLDYFIDTTSTNEYEYNDLINLGYIPLYDCGRYKYIYTK